VKCSAEERDAIEEPGRSADRPQTGWRAPSLLSLFYPPVTGGRAKYFFPWQKPVAKLNGTPLGGLGRDVGAVRTQRHAGPKRLPAPAAASQPAHHGAVAGQSGRVEGRRSGAATGKILRRGPGEERPGQSGVTSLSSAHVMGRGALPAVSASARPRQIVGEGLGPTSSAVTAIA